MLRSSLNLQRGGAVAQLGARLDGIEEVVGSNPIGSTNIYLRVVNFDSPQNQLPALGISLGPLQRIENKQVASLQAPCRISTLGMSLSAHFSAMLGNIAEQTGV
jgi:hypothetical protein